MNNRTRTISGIGAAAAVAMAPAALPAAASAAKKKKATKSSTKKYVGKTEKTYFGKVQVSITVQSKKIKTLSISASPDSQNSYQLEAYALPLLRKEALKKSTYKIHLVSGVTISSEAFDASLYSAMGHAHLV